MIKYHDTTIKPEYGADHKLLNNWNPDRNICKKIKEDKEMEKDVSRLK